jgi:hypothetical protein
MRATVMYGVNDVRIEHVPDVRLSQPVPFDWAGQVAAFLMTDTLCEGGICL